MISSGSATITVAIITGAARSGEASQPLMQFNANAADGFAADFVWPVNAVTARV